YELIYSNKVSTYNLLSDSIIKRKSKTVNKRTEVIFEIYLGNAYKDFKKRIYLRQEDFGGSKYLVKRSTDENKWVDVDSTKTILGYMCKKARLESDSTATVWYATTIPIPDGPYSFFGSPGLVLEASSKRVYFVAESVSQLTSIPNIEKPKAGKVVSEDDLRGLALKFLVSTHKSE
ncbi:MAG: hypothetical protein RIS47_865, partial [Bacteroidota bacterium]